LRNRYQYDVATKTTAPTRFPVPASSQFSRMSAQDRPSTPANLAAGRKNMLATTWSNPIATKAMIGKKMARILPDTEVAASDIHTARQTSQLQPKARRKVCHAECAVALSSAIAASRSWVIAAVLPEAASTPPITPVWTARKNATNRAPSRFPSRTRVRFLATSPTSSLPRIAPSGTSIMFPVARSDPAMRTSTRPSVKAVPVNSVGRVPHVRGSRPEETVIATRPPNAM
jgi:hypothetical protein